MEKEKEIKLVCSKIVIQLPLATPVLFVYFKCVGKNINGRIFFIFIHFVSVRFGDFFCIFYQKERKKKKKAEYIRNKEVYVWYTSTKELRCEVKWNEVKKLPVT